MTDIETKLYFLVFSLFRLASNTFHPDIPGYLSKLNYGQQAVSVFFCLYEFLSKSIFSLHNLFLHIHRMVYLKDYTYLKIIPSFLGR